MLKIEFGCVQRASSGSVALGSAVFCAVMGLASLAAAQAAEPAPATPAADDPEAAPDEPPPSINLTGSPAPGIDLATPAPAPPVARKFHQHEGFYVRVAAGLGALLSADIDAPGGELSTGGLTLNYDVLVGGSPAPGFALGGGLLGGLQMSGDWETSAGVGVDGGDMTTLIIGPFADGHPEPKGGLHFGGLAGLARVAFDVPGADETALGFGGAFWAGHDVWVAPEWSLGGLLRLDALRATDDDVTVTEVGLTLMFSVLYN